LAHHDYQSPLIAYCRAAFIIVGVLALPTVAVCWNVMPHISVASILNKQTVIEDETSYRLSDTTTECDTIGNSQPDNSRLDEIPEPLRKIESVTSLPTPSSLPLPNARHSEIQPASFTESKAEPQYASQFSAQSVEQELQQLGATSYRLQTWGDSGNLFRFTCYVGAPSNPNYQRHFQSIDSDPHNAMRLVIKEIKEWLNGGK
jgi:hypothetical protein